MDGYAGGILLFLVVAAVWVIGVTAMLITIRAMFPAVMWVLHLFLVYSLLALGDLVRIPPVRTAAPARPATVRGGFAREGPALPILSRRFRMSPCISRGAGSSAPASTMTI